MFTFELTSTITANYGSPFIVTSYYTKGTGYESEVERLIDSLDSLQISYDIHCIKNMGDWSINTRYKPLCIKEVLKVYPKVVFIDADAVVKSYPGLFDILDCDFACHYRNKRELLSGTLFFQDSQNTLDLLDWWMMENEKNTCTEQRNLQKIIDTKKVRNLIMAELPASYVQIFDLMANNGDPVISHHQASRRFRKEVSR